MKLSIMEVLSISKIIKRLKEKDKVYLTNYHNNGYELGFGKRGFYKGHSHYFFYDILFSPYKLIVSNEQTPQNNFLLVVPPRTFMNDIEIGDFFFLKFCPTNETFLLPEKTDEVLKEGKIIMHSSATQLSFSWFKTPNIQSKININAKPNELIITFNNHNKIKILL